VKYLSYQVTLYSSIEFDVDKELELNGIADYLIGVPPLQIVPASPILAVAEAKVTDVMTGLGQCIAEMYAVRLFNERDGIFLPKVYGIVTDGKEWMFLELENNTVRQQPTIGISQLSQIIGTLVLLFKEQLNQYHLAKEKRDEIIKK